MIPRPRIVATSKADRRNLCYFCPRTAAVHVAIDDTGTTLTFDVCSRHSDLTAREIIEAFVNQEKIKCKVG
jgi:hypothetical protein